LDHWNFENLLKKESDTVNAVPELDVPFKIIRCHAVRVRLLSVYVCVCMYVSVCFGLGALVTVAQIQTKQHDDSNHCCFGTP